MEPVKQPPPPAPQPPPSPAPQRPASDDLGKIGKGQKPSGEVRG
jgi:hypothetical protein